MLGTVLDISIDSVLYNELRMFDTFITASDLYLIPNIQTHITVP